MIERTLSIVKPDAVAKHATGAILAQCERAGLRIQATKMLRMTKRQAEAFYAVHRTKPFFDDLTTFMSEGPIVVSVLEGESAIARYRKELGDTNPAKAEPGTIRKQHGTNIERNAAHGSDGPETAAFEIGFFFAQIEQQTG